MKEYGLVSLAVLLDALYTYIYTSCTILLFG